MSPRPRTRDDAAILAAATTAIIRLGPAKVTLADVAREAKLSPAALVQRFGSKRGLLLALAKSAVDGVEACFAAVRSAHPAPLDALIAAATDMTRFVQGPEEMANHLAFLQMDLSDPDFHRLALDNAARIRAGYVALLNDAVVEGELARCDTARLGAAIESMSGGSLIAWAIHRRGDATAWVRKDIETLIAPYRETRPRRGSAGAKRSGPRSSKAKRSPAREMRRR
jgi:AcrR family transcriptional regulator